MNSFGEKLFSSTKQSTGDNNDGGSTITGLSILSGGDIDKLNNDKKS